MNFFIERDYEGKTFHVEMVGIDPSHKWKVGLDEHVAWEVSQNFGVDIYAGAFIVALEMFKEAMRDEKEDER